jgi:hypothetical protein
MSGLRGRVGFAIADGNSEVSYVLPETRLQCVCCGARFRAGEVYIGFMGHDICEDCVLSGPKEMARRIRERLPKEKMEWVIKLLKRIARSLDKKESTADVPGGIYAVKVAEALREVRTKA